MSKIIMAGPLKGFDVTSVLQAVSLSRQFTTLRLWDDSDKPSGTLELKAGQVLGATSGHASGGRAFTRILHSTDHRRFQVERHEDPAKLPQPMGSLSSLLLNLPQQPRAATVARPAAPPPAPAAKRSLPKKRPIPRPPARDDVATAPQREVQSVSGALAALASSMVPLRSLLLAQVPDCLTCRSWSRVATGISPDTLATFAAAVVQSQRASLGPEHAANADAIVTVELPTETIIVRSLDEQVVAAYVFEPNVALGLARLVVSQLHEPLSQRALQEMHTLHAAG